MRASSETVPPIPTGASRRGSSSSGGPDATVVVDLRGLADRPWDAARLLLVGDVVCRVEAELRGRHPALVLVQDRPERDTLDAEHTATVMGSAAPTAHASSFAELAGLPEGPARIVLEPVRPVQSAPCSAAADAGHSLRVGPVVLRAGAGARPSPDDLVRDRDPLALRLALLHVPWTDPAHLSLARLHRADETLDRWRFKVAGWWYLPAEPAPGELDALDAALVADLDTAAALRLLHRLEMDPRASSGSKFAAFTRLDRVLGLDLRRLVGRVGL